MTFPIILLCIFLGLLTIAFLAKLWSCEHAGKISVKKLLTGIKYVIILMVVSYLTTDEWWSDQDDY